VTPRECTAWVLVTVLGVCLLALPPEPEQDLQLVDRTLTLAEQCAETTHTALRALLPRYETAPPPDSLAGG
jgi:hypothetical protein